MASRHGLFVLGITVLAAEQAGAQSVVSVRAGLLNFSEGAVFINNQPVKQRAGAFPALQEGSDLLTQSGRAELLLTPSAYLRIGQNSAVRMLSNRLTDTRVEFLYGSAMLDSTQALENCSVTLVFKERQIRIAKPGKYRIDSEPAQFRVFQGSAEVAGSNGPLTLEADQMLPLDGASVVKRFTEGSDDLLDIWSDERHFMIASNLSSAQNITDPANTDSSMADAGDLGAYLGYIPPAAISPAPIAPLVMLYNPYPSGLLGLGYYGPYAMTSMYVPFYLYSGALYSRRPYLGASGFRYTQTPIYGISPRSPIYGYTPTGGIITRSPGIGIGGGRTIGVGISRPVGGIGVRPTGHVAAHR